MLKFLKGKIQRRYLIDIWGKYRLRLHKENIDKTAKYFYKINKLLKDMWAFRNKRYVYQLRVFYKFNPPKRLDPEFVKSKMISFYYFNLSTWKLKKILERSFRVKATPLHYLFNRLDGRFLYILFKLGYEQNLFLIERKFAYHKPFIINNKVVSNANTFLNLGDWCYIKPKMRRRMYKFFLNKLYGQQILQWFPNNFLFEPVNFLFMMMRPYKKSDVFFFNKIDIMKINELGHFLR